MRIQHNIMAMNAYRNYNNNTSKLSKNLEKLSSGYKINRAGDDAAGLAISEKMRAQITGPTQAQANAKSGINLVQTAEGALQEVHDMLNRMVKLADQSANGIYKDNGVDRQALQDEVKALKDEIDRISKATNFNGTNLLDGSLGGGATEATAGAVEVGDLTGMDGDIGLSAAGIEAPVYEDGVSDEDKTALADALIADGLTISVSNSNTDVAASINSDYVVKFSDGSGDVTTTADWGNVTSIDIYAADGSTKLASLAVDTAAVSTAANGTTKIEFTAADGAEETAATSTTYESTLEGDDGTNALAAGDTIEIDGKTYELGSTTGGDAKDIDIDTEDTFAKQMQAAIDLYNAESDTEYTAAYEQGKVTFTPKDGVTPTADPTLTITDAASKISAGEVTEVEGETADKGLNLQIGDTSEPHNKIQVSINDMSTKGLKIDGIDISTEKGASDAVEQIKNAIDIVSTQRGKLGAVQNRLEHTINNLSVMTENIQDAESTIRDTDVADEMMAYTKNNILIQSAQAMLAQANQVPQGVLQLLQ